MDAIVDLRGDMNTRFADVNQRFTEMNQQLAELRSDMNLRFNQFDARFTVMDAKVDRLFVWVIGLLVGGFTSMLGALIGVGYR